MLGYPSPAETLREREAALRLRSSTQPTHFYLLAKTYAVLGDEGDKGKL
jgi:hypothetical protein